MSTLLKTGLQKGMINFFGFEKYLSIISDIRIKTFHRNKKQNEFRKFVSMIPAECHVLDIGANIGVTSYYLSKYTTKCDIHSFEPMPFNYEVLKRNVMERQLKNVHTYNIGLGAKANTLQMILPIIDGVKRHALCQVYDSNSLYKEGIKFPISIERLDDLPSLKAFKGNIKGVKLDVEGFELQVLKGGKDLFVQNRPIVFCEFWDNNLKHQIAQYFKELKYDVMIWKEGRLINFYDILTTKGNFFMIPSEIEAR